MTRPDNKHTTQSKIFGILFLIAFVGTIIAMFITAQTDPVLCVLIVLCFFGFMFLLGGIQTISRPNTGSLVFLTLGLELLVGAFAIYRILYGDEGQRARMLHALPKLGCGGCALLGAVLLFGGILIHRSQLKRCSQELTATVTDVNIMFDRSDSTGRRRNRYAPMVRYSWYGAEYEIQLDVYEAGKTYNVGDEITIFINPDQPEDIRLPGRSMIGGSTIFGILLIGAAVGVYLLLGNS